MFIKRNRTQHNDKSYRPILLVQGKRVPGKRLLGRPAAGAPPRKTVVVHETFANLSRLPAELVALIDGFCHDALPKTSVTTRPAWPPPAAAPTVQVGPCYGLLAGLHALARELGIVRTVGETTRTSAWRFTSFTPG
jgi:hypothetical protein